MKINRFSDCRARGCATISRYLSESGYYVLGQWGRNNLEGSKLHAKTIMHVGVPTAEFVILDSGSDIESALELINQPVIKRDVLAEERM